MRIPQTIGRLVLLLALIVPVVAADAPPATSTRPTTAPAARQDGIAVYFSPNGGCADAIIAAIDSARATIDVQAYRFSSTPIAEALASAHHRGVRVRFILDKHQADEPPAAARLLRQRQVPVWIDDEHSMNHNKVMLIDSHVIITGSYNFTIGAERSSAENLLFITGKQLLQAAYQENFDRHFTHSTPWEDYQPQ